MYVMCSANNRAVDVDNAQHSLTLGMQMVLWEPKETFQMCFCKMQGVGKQRRPYLSHDGLPRMEGC